MPSKSAPPQQFVMISRCVEALQRAGLAGACDRPETRLATALNSPP